MGALEREGDRTYAEKNCRRLESGSGICFVKISQIAFETIVCYLEHPIQCLVRKFHQIEVVPALQQRVCENFAVVSQYKEMLELSDPPPLTVYRVGDHARLS